MRDDDDTGAIGETLALQVGPTTLLGQLSIPESAQGIILIAHGSGSGLRNAASRLIAGRLYEQGFATLVLDLLTAEEQEADERMRHLRFNVGLLGARMVAATDWLGRSRRTANLPVGYLASSIGAAAALVAAAERPTVVCAVVSRGGRPDLAGDALPRVRSATLIIVGGQETVLEELSLEAMNRMQSEVGFAVIPRANHLFDEPGTMDEVADLATDWFEHHLLRWMTRSGERRVAEWSARRAGMT